MVILSMLMAAAWLPTMPPKRLGPADAPTVDRYLLWRGDYDRTPKVPEPLDLEPFGAPAPDGNEVPQQPSLRAGHHRKPKMASRPLDHPFAASGPKQTGADRPLRLDNRLGSLRR